MAEEKGHRQAPSCLKIAELLHEKAFGLRLLAGESGLSREVFLSHLQKPGLVLAGHLEHLNPDKIQVLGLTEIAYLRKLTEAELGHVIDNLLQHSIVCFITTKSLTPPACFLEATDRKGIPVLQSPDSTSTFIKKMTRHLEKRLAPQATIHGVLMSIQGVGVLILGQSGIGKSECALDLVRQGHRLVADDLIYLQRIGHDVLVGFGPELIRHHMEIRGLGIINIKDLFGVVSVMDSSKVELIVELVVWSETSSYDRLGLEEESISILDMRLPKVRIPVSPGRNLSVILEVAARNHLLKKRGYHAAREVDIMLIEALRKASAEDASAEEGSR